MQKIYFWGIISLLGLFLGFQSWAVSDDSSDASPASATKHADYVAAQKAIKSHNYQEAIALLNRVDRAFPQNADVFNLLGYSYRLLEDYTTSKKYYLQALKIDPTHRGANEYLGELYLQTGQLEEAQKRLEALDKACIFGCEEYDELKEAIETYQKQHNL